MKTPIALMFLVIGALLLGGCATKKYVRDTTSPIQAKADQVGQQATQNSQRIEDTRGEVKQVDEKAQNGISAAQERAAAADRHAAAADQHASEAMNRANQAAQVGDQNTQQLKSLSTAVANIDDYRMQSSATLLFEFDRYTLGSDAKGDLDRLAQDAKADKRFFITVEGHTDSIGSKAYNEALSRRRADAVVQYLVTAHAIPIFRIHMIGLGQEKPVEEAHGRAAQAKNRRVEVKVFSADHVAGSAEVR